MKMSLPVVRLFTAHDVAGNFSVAPEGNAAIAVTIAARSSVVPSHLAPHHVTSAGMLDPQTQPPVVRVTMKPTVLQKAPSNQDCKSDVLGAAQPGIPDDAIVFMNRWDAQFVGGTGK